MMNWEMRLREGMVLWRVARGRGRVSVLGEESEDEADEGGVRR